MAVATDSLADRDVSRESGEALHVVFAGGGSGGHLYPALAITEALRARCAGVRVTFFATDRALDARVLGKAGEEMVPQTVKPLTVRPWRMPAFLRAWRAATRRCRKSFEASAPSVVVGTGGFASGPAVWVASRMGIPTALLNPDLIPGKANRYLASRVDRVFAQWPETKSRFRRGVNVVATGCPVRSAFATATREAGIARFGLSPDRRTLLITGASQGSHAINESMAALAPDVASVSCWQVVHLTGDSDSSAVERAYREAGVAAKVLTYSEHMAEAMAAADLIVSRAGASTLAEIAAAGKPSILVPYPHHRDQHQLAQARLLAMRGAACVVCECSEMNATVAGLRTALMPLLSDDVSRVRLEAGAANLRLADAAEVVAEEIERLAMTGCDTKRVSGMKKTRAV